MILPDLHTNLLVNVVAGGIIYVRKDIDGGNC